MIQVKVFSELGASSLESAINHWIKTNSYKINIIRDIKYCSDDNRHRAMIIYET